MLPIEDFYANIGAGSAANSNSTGAGTGNGATSVGPQNGAQNGAGQGAPERSLDGIMGSFGAVDNALDSLSGFTAASDYAAYGLEPIEYEGGNPDGVQFYTQSEGAYTDVEGWYLNVTVQEDPRYLMAIFSYFAEDFTPDEVIAALNGAQRYADDNRAFYNDRFSVYVNFDNDLELVYHDDDSYDETRLRAALIDGEGFYLTMTRLIDAVGAYYNITLISNDGGAWLQIGVMLPPHHYND